MRIEKKNKAPKCFLHPLGDIEVPVRMVYSARKTLALEVHFAEDQPEVILRMPNQMTEQTALHFVQIHEQWLVRAVRKVRSRGESPMQAELPAAREAELRAQAKAVLPQKTAEYAARMGVQYTGVRITSAQTRFGSCSAQNHICYSWRLMQYPEAAIDYVVVHELAHTVHKNHSAAFYGFVEQILPDYRSRKLLLRGKTQTE